MTTNEETPGPLLSLDDEPIWVVQAPDGSKVLFDPDPIATQGWDDLMQMKTDLSSVSQDDTTPGKEVLDRLHDILGKFCVDAESKKAWRRSVPTMGLKKTLGLMKVYVEKVQGEDDLPT